MHIDPSSSMSLPTPPTPTRVVSISIFQSNHASNEVQEQITELVRGIQGYTHRSGEMLVMARTWTTIKNPKGGTPANRLEFGKDRWMTLTELRKAPGAGSILAEVKWDEIPKLEAPSDAEVKWDEIPKLEAPSDAESICGWRSLFWLLPCMQGRVKETYGVQQRVATKTELLFTDRADSNAKDLKAGSDLEPPKSIFDWDANDGGFFGAGCLPGLSRRGSWSSK